MSNVGQIQPETLQGKDLANAARATWREMKASIQADDFTKAKMTEILEELSYRVENNSQTHQQALQGQPTSQQNPTPQGHVQPVRGSSFGGSGGGGGGSYNP